MSDDTKVSFGTASEIAISLNRLGILRDDDRMRIGEYLEGRTLLYSEVIAQIWYACRINETPQRRAITRSICLTLLPNLDDNTLLYYMMNLPV